MGLWVLRAEWDPEGWRAGRRLKRAGRLLRKAGVLRVLTPEGFQGWEALRRFGLREVDPAPFLRAHAAPLAVAALEKRGERPERCAVALRGARAEREMIRAAHALSQRFREVCVSAPGGGEELGRAMREEYGMAVRPDWPGVPAAVRFDASADMRGGAVLSLFAPRPELAGVEIGWKEGEPDGGTDLLPLLAALWEAGKVGEGALEFT